MVVRSFALCLFIFLLINNECCGDPAENSCNWDMVKRGKHSCTDLNGKFQFNTHELNCTVEQFKEVTTLYGVIIFENGSYIDPMGCFPQLTYIIVLEDSQYVKPAITVKAEVTDMESFTILDNLVIHHHYPNENYIDIDQKTNFKMDSERYKTLLARYGSKKIFIPHKKDGECEFKTSIQFLDELEKCETVVGTLKINSSLISPIADVQRLYHVDSIEIIGTNLDLENLYFLKDLRSAVTMAIHDNPKLCFPDKFLEQIGKISPFISKVERNGSPAICDGACSGAHIESETINCTSVWGDVYLTRNSIKQLKYVSMIKGRLLIRGFDENDPFKFLPNLKKVETSSKKPAVLISENSGLKTLNVPKDLEIIAEGRFLISVVDSPQFIMSNEEFHQLALRYGDSSLNITILESKECHFRDPVVSLSELNDCEIIFGDLVLNGNITGQTTTTVKKVTGCIRIEETNLTDAHWLKIGDDSSKDCYPGHTLINNKEMCPAPVAVILARTNGGAGDNTYTVYGNKVICPTFCYSHNLHNDESCAVIEEGISIPIGFKESRQFLTSLVNVEEIKGPIRFRGTDLQNIDVFNSLKIISVSENEPAITIVGNDDLRRVDFPHLEEINLKNNKTKLIVIKGNGNYSMSYEQYKELADKYGEKRLDIEHDEEEKNRTTVNRKYVEEGEEDALRLACGIIGGTLLFVIVIHVIKVVASFAVKKRKNKSNQAENEPLLKKEINTQLKSPLHRKNSNAALKTMAKKDMTKTPNNLNKGKQTTQKKPSSTKLSDV